MKIIRLNSENYERYAGQIVALCDSAVEENEKNNRSGQFFTSTLEELLGYVNSNGRDLVIMAINESDIVEGAMYINTEIKQGTYSDLTKYFHTSARYKEYMASQFDDNSEYQDYIAYEYISKILTFNEIAQEIEQDTSLNPDGLIFKELISAEIAKDNFQENNPIREAINRKFFEKYAKANKTEDYEKTAFYGIEDIDINVLNRIIAGRISKEELNYLISSYEVFLSSQAPIFALEPNIDMKKYYEANMRNTIEFNTYVVSPEQRSNGLAKILVYETLKRIIPKIFNNPNNDKMFISTTIHNDNENSQATANFFGLEDYIYIERKKGINRRVYMKSISREEYLDYLYDIELELLISYNYYSELFGVIYEDAVEMINNRINHYQNKIKNETNSNKLRYYESRIEALNELLNKMNKKMK